MFEHKLHFQGLTPDHTDQVLPVEFYDRDTITVARELLGHYLVRVEDGRRRVGRIVETEAYLGGHDRASHSSRGLTQRNRVMFGPPGHAYVYLVYGMYYCLNVVTESAGHGAAVLLRALEPLENVTGRTKGPGLLCRALGIDLTLNGQDLFQPELHVARSSEAQPSIVARPRIGVDYAGPRWARRRLRFYLRNNPFVSRP